MTRVLPLSVSLRKLTNPDTSPEEVRLAVSGLVHEAHRMAMAYMRLKTQHRLLQSAVLGLTMEDLALDCIADLFQRNEEGRFSQLMNYFGTITDPEVDEPELQMAFRRLVFSKVNEGLFRRYREVDPSLAKVIRNLKLALNGCPDLSLRRLGHELWIVAGGPSTPLASLPLAPIETLEHYLIAHIEDACNLPQIASLLVQFHRDFPGYCNGYPLTGFAQIVRSAHVQSSLAPEDDDPEPAFLPEEVRRAIAQAVDAVQSRMHSSYVAKAKVDAATYATYFRAINAVLVAEYLELASPVSSHYDALKAHMPNLTAATYRREHRHIFEYLNKLARAQFVSLLQSVA